MRRYETYPLLHLPHRHLAPRRRQHHAQLRHALTYPISAEISNLYVPGIHTNAASTVARVFTGYALDPTNNLLTEFLPDVASRIHVRIIFVQRILNNIASSNGSFRRKGAGLRKSRPIHHPSLPFNANSRRSLPAASRWQSMCVKL